MFEHLGRFAYILVTGPQRSGTQICAAMIAHDLPGHKIVTEKDLGAVDSLNDLLGKMAVATNLVIQCPALSKWAHYFGDRSDVLIVWMKRDIKEIVASQVRIDWTLGGVAELMRYGEIGARHFSADSNRAATVKIDFFERFQKQCIQHLCIMQYRDLQAHSLWVPDDLRRDFGAHQTRPDGRPV